MKCLFTQFFQLLDELGKTTTFGFNKQKRKIQNENWDSVGFMLVIATLSTPLMAQTRVKQLQLNIYFMLHRLSHQADEAETYDGKFIFQPHYLRMLPF